MPTGAYSRDENSVPITTNGILIKKSITLTGSSATVATPLFRVTGIVQVVALYGVVTTALGSNQTAAYFRFNDQTAQPDITLATGVVVSSAAVGSLIVKKGLVGAAAVLSTSAAGRVTEPTTLETGYFSPFVLVQKTGNVESDIEYVYTTNQTPTTGAIEFVVGYIPLSDDGAITAL